MNSIRFLVFILIVHISFSAPIKIKCFIEVEKEKVYFSDIVDELYEGPDFFIAYSPPPGIEKKIDIIHLKFKLKSYDLEPISNSNFILIKRKEKILDISELEKFIKEYIERKLENLGGKIFIEIEKSQNILIPFSENITFSIRHPKKSFILGKVPLIIEIRDSNRKIKEITVKTNIEIEREFFVAKEDIKIGETIDDKIESQVKKISYLVGSPILNEKDLKGKIAKVFITKGSILTNRMIDIKPLVKKGDIVSINLEEGGLKVKMEFVALESGKENEIIWVKNLSSGKKVKIKITGEKKGELI